MKIVLTLLAVGMISLLSFVTVFNKDDSTPNNSTNQSSQSSPEAVENQILISDFKFTPETLTVKKGTTVNWINKDTAKHDVNFSDESLTDGPLLEQNASFSYTFMEAGMFDYACSPHPFMKATVIVTE
jgi:amicyanin